MSFESEQVRARMVVAQEYARFIDKYFNQINKNPYFVTLTAEPYENGVRQGQEIVTKWVRQFVDSIDLPSIFFIEKGKGSFSKDRTSFIEGKWHAHGLVDNTRFPTSLVSPNIRTNWTHGHVKVEAVKNLYSVAYYISKGGLMVAGKYIGHMDSTGNYAEFTPLVKE